MEPFKRVSSIVTPLDKVNVDTDQIVPKQFLKLVQKSGFGKFLFFDWRYDPQKNERSDFVLNNPQYRNSKILVTGDNFGCGSSREHAVWALLDYGFSAVIAPSFADIFFSNCFKNGLLPITLDQKIVEKLLEETGTVEIDLENQVIKTPLDQIPFRMDSYQKKILLEGLDDIALTFQYEDRISKFERESKIPSLL